MREHLKNGSVFECNCQNDTEFKEMIDQIHEEDAGWNFGVSSRLWLSRYGETVMVEHQVSTKTARNLLENEDEPDWFTAYKVDDENDCDCSTEVFSETADPIVSVDGIKGEMFDFAERVFERFYKEA